MAQERVRRSLFDLAGSRSQTRTDDGSRSIDIAGANAAGQRFWPTLVLVALCQLADLITFNFAVATFGPALGVRAALARRAARPDASSRRGDDQD